ncbi:MAG TPA: class I SAM-dependent methyltransferase [Macromonas sp.]|nr:class I SAM-dependent methyltransferase [Macromonas sp.]
MLGRLSRASWPLPAVLVWALAWGVLWAVRASGGTPLTALLAATLTGVLGSVWGGVSRWRRALIALGFPLSWGLVSGVLVLPSWVWLVLAALLLVLYPPSTWKDAPLYPTPPDAFDGLREAVHLPWGGHVLDAGCGLGHGLVALNRAWPDLHMHGIERSWPLALLCRLRCRWATVRQGDMWAEDWSRYDLVYLFQRPESMPRAMDKAARELKPGAWLASLEFAPPEGTPVLTWECPDGRTLWLYRQAQAPSAG